MELKVKTFLLISSLNLIRLHDSPNGYGLAATGSVSFKIASAEWKCAPNFRSSSDKKCQAARIKEYSINHNNEKRRLTFVNRLVLEVGLIGQNQIRLVEDLKKLSALYDSLIAENQNFIDLETDNGMSVELSRKRNWKNRLHQ
ncbi:hypothetical protein JHJ32_08280 [Parapedobacter sp. ISTM3]|uniref:hypothetical protein n=1 Tax=Parapedobacter sp. ISTM3 TaxID=2800130 RepID=UPI0019046A4E|nr:hypothetical protein [Parapedobacter sp. ISTM3]MBK1439978.1 hypothetical protein [Parapedobacter sp. ISTM3]